MQENISGLWCLLHLGLFCRTRDRLSEAKETVLRVLNTYRGNGLADSRGVFQCQYELGGICWEREEWDEAEQRYVEALAGFDRILGPNDEYTKFGASVLGDFRKKRQETADTIDGPVT